MHLEKNSNTSSLLLGNPVVITTREHLYFVYQDVLTLGERIQTFFISGNPQPSLANITWLLNGTSPPSNLANLDDYQIGLTSLRIPSTVTYEHSGNYTIRVNTSAGVAEDSFTITVGGECVQVNTWGSR